MKPDVHNDLSKSVENIQLNNEPASNSHTFRHTVKRNHLARDVTEEFVAYSRNLTIGELVKDESFTLFESVQALEIMDPKMDGGCLYPGETLYDEYNIAQALSAEEVLGIIDKLLCYEMAWHQGYPLAQNLFTSHYIDNLLSQERLPRTFPMFVNPRNHVVSSDPLIQSVLRAYCLATIWTCNKVIEMIWSQHYFEDEDFSTFVYVRNLLDDMSEQDCLRMLMDAHTWLAKQSKAEVNTRSALLKRLTVRADFLKIVNLMQYDEIDWIEIMAPLTDLKDSHSFAKPVPKAFSHKIQRKLANTTPPRPIINVDFDTAVDQLTQLYRDLEYSKTVTNLETLPNFDITLTFLWDYATRQPPPSTYARAVLQGLVFSDQGAAGPSGTDAWLAEVLRQSMWEICLNEDYWQVEVPSDHRYILARAVDYYMEQAAPDYTNVLRCICQNSCRIRRCLTNVLDDFAGLRNDVSVRRRTWTEGMPKNSLVKLAVDQILKIVEKFQHTIVGWIIRLGFEHDIYQPHELAMMFHCYATIILHEQECMKNSRSVAEELLGTRDRSLTLNELPLKLDASTLRSEIQRGSIRKESLDLKRTMTQSFSLLYTILASCDPAFQPSKPRHSTLALQWELRLRPLLSVAEASNALSSYDAVHAAIFTSQIDLPARLERCLAGFDAAKCMCLMQLKARPAITGETDEHHDATLEVAVHKASTTELKGLAKVCIKAGLLARNLLEVMAAKGSGVMDDAVWLADRVVSVKVPDLGRRDVAWCIVPEVEFKVAS